MLFLFASKEKREHKGKKSYKEKSKPSKFSITMKTRSSSSTMLFLFALLQLLAAAAPSLAQGFDFFYFVQMWPGAYCDRKQSCCYPTTGKPAPDFGIHGLWPNYKYGSYPSNCDPDSEFEPSVISDLIPSLQKDWPTLACPSSDGTKFWEHEWEKHGTCSESVLNQLQYFEAALKLKEEVNLLQILVNAGIKPDGGFYSLTSITDAITEALGFTPGIECNVDASRNSQLYQIYICVDTSGSNLIKCPVLPSPRRKCASQVEFPYFGGDFIRDEISMVVSS